MRLKLKQWLHDSVHYIVAALLWVLLSASITVGQDEPYNDPVAQAYVSSVAYSPDGTKIAVASGSEFCSLSNNDYLVQIFSTQTGDVLQTLRFNLCTTTSLRWHSGGDRLIGSTDEFVIVWDVNSAQILSRYRALTPAPLFASEWRPNSNQVATIARADANLKLWDANTGQISFTLNANYPSALAWNSDGSSIAMRNANDIIEIYSTNNWLVENTITMPNVRLLRWSPNNNNLAGGTTDNTIYIWNSSTGELNATLNGHTDFIAEIVWSPDSQVLASASYDGTLRIWNAQNGIQVDQINSPGRIYALDWSPDGTQISYGGSRNDGEDAALEVAILPTVISAEEATATSVPTATPVLRPAPTSTVSATPTPGR